MSLNLEYLWRESYLNMAHGADTIRKSFDFRAIRFDGWQAMLVVVFETFRLPILMHLVMRFHLEWF